MLDRSTAYPLWGLRAGRRALELVRQKRADIVHGFGASVLGYARRARRTRRGQAATAPLVMNPQGLEEFGATDPSRAPLKRAAYLPLRRSVILCASAADAVIATDRSLEPLRVAASRHPAGADADDSQRARSAHAGRDDRYAHGRGPADYHRLALGERIMLSVGRLEASKGFHVLLRALAAVREHGTLDGRPWRWVALGDGPYRPMLDMLAADLQLERHVRFLGRVRDHEMHAWHELSTLFVHPTLYEGSSLVTLEAMAHRRAVVASAAGGIPDKVRPGQNGWLVAPGDPSTLAAAISGAIARSRAPRALRPGRARHCRAGVLVGRGRRRHRRAVPRIDQSRFGRSGNLGIWKSGELRSLEIRKPDLASSRLGLVLALVAAAMLRFWALSQGIPFSVQVDEPEVMVRAVGMMKTGDLNPHFFDYPSLYIYMEAIVAVAGS